MEFDNLAAERVDRANILRHKSESSEDQRCRAASRSSREQASIYAALCDLTLTRLLLRRINTRIASRRTIAIDTLIDLVMELCYLEWRAVGAAMVREGRSFCRSVGNQRIILKRPGNQRSEYVGRMDAPSFFTPIIKRAYRVSGQMERLRFLHKIGSRQFSEFTIRYESAIPRILCISETIAPHRHRWRW